MLTAVGLPRTAKATVVLLLNPRDIKLLFQHFYFTFIHRVLTHSQLTFYQFKRIKQYTSF
jgi:hypothetical protein